MCDACMHMQMYIVYLSHEDHFSYCGLYLYIITSAMPSFRTKLKPQLSQSFQTIPSNIWSDSGVAVLLYVYAVAQFLFCTVSTNAPNNRDTEGHTSKNLYICRAVVGVVFHFVLMEVNSIIMKV